MRNFVIAVKVNTCHLYYKSEINSLHSNSAWARKSQYHLECNRLNFLERKNKSNSNMNQLRGSKIDHFARMKNASRQGLDTDSKKLSPVNNYAGNRGILMSQYETLHFIREKVKVTSSQWE